MIDRPRRSGRGRGGTGGRKTRGGGRTESILRAARRRGERTLSEHDSKRVLSAYGIKVNREVLVSSLTAARAAARKLGYPVVLKACGAEHSHKSERGLVEVDLGSARELGTAFAALSERAGSDDAGAFLVQEMVAGRREVMVGMHRDPSFGPSVMFGLGGIFAEVLEDVVFRVAPLRKRDAIEMMRGIRGHRILDAVRGMPAVDVDALSRTLIAVGRVALDHAAISEIDINPLIIRGREPVAVDALVALTGEGD